MAMIARPFNFSLGTAYAGLTATISYQVVVGGSVVVGPVTGTGVTEGAFGTFTATGSYNVEIADFDTSWVGRIVWYESTNGILYEEPFTATQSGDSFPTVSGSLDATVSSRQASGIAVTLPDTAPNGWIDTPAFAAGATVPAVAAATVGSYATGQDPATLLVASESFLGAVASAVLTDAEPANQNNPGSLGAVVRSSTGIFATGTVNDTDPSTSSFVISLDDGQALPTDNRYVGLGLWFTRFANLAPAKQTIGGYELLTSSTARITLQTPFSGTPADASTFEIG